MDETPNTNGSRPVKVISPPVTSNTSVSGLSWDVNVIFTPKSLSSLWINSWTNMAPEVNVELPLPPLEMVISLGMVKYLKYSLLLVAVKVVYLWPPRLGNIIPGISVSSKIEIGIPEISKVVSPVTSSKDKWARLSPSRSEPSWYVIVVCKSVLSFSTKSSIVIILPSTNNDEGSVILWVVWVVIVAKWT